MTDTLNLDMIRRAKEIVKKNAVKTAVVKNKEQARRFTALDRKLCAYLGIPHSRKWRVGDEYYVVLCPTTMKIRKTVTRA